MKIFFTVILLLASAIPALAQSSAQIERELVAAIKELRKYSTYAGNYDEDKLLRAQKIFEQKLVKHTKNPATLQYKFSALDKLMYIATSEDGRFRIYSWDLEDGGTMHNFARVYQYLGTDGKVYSKGYDSAEEPSGSFVTDIFTLETAGGKVYIVSSTYICSSVCRGQSADLYKIEGSTLNDKVKLIKTKSGLTNTLSFGYTSLEPSVKLIHFDKKTKTLRIPVVIDDQEFPDGKVTNRFINYRFDGTHFVKVG